ncbi:phosphatidylinositol 4,5-bisphosphate-binding protein [Paecilomyces lecythidis]|uniref:Phosphatidylinositol 4,5-bisphosphate-binding protein n=1 Tax=Paecilomyces lecythidis TaxID=3004212 RepID=A0ABR3WMP6_9EURO
MTMAARPDIPAQDGYGSVPHPTDPTHLSRGYGGGSGSRPASYVANSDYNAAHGALEPSHLAHPTRFHEELDNNNYDYNQRNSAVMDGSSAGGLHRSDSQSSHAPSVSLSRGGTLKKKGSLNKRGSLRRSGSRKSLRAGSVRSLHLGDKEKYGVDGADNLNSAFFVPIPTNGSPTDVLASRFQSWRKVLKDLIVFFKDLQKSYETRSKLLLSASNIVNNTSLPPTFLESGGLGDATEILRDYHRQGIAEAARAKEIENEVIIQLTGLRSDLQQKTKEIKSLSGDFKNSVDKEVEGTRKAVRNLQEALGLVDLDPAATSGKGDPYIVRLHVDRQLEKQIEEENYLHRAFLNLESSGRELESIVVGEIQKAYNAYANILKREAEQALDAAEKLRVGPVSMPRDHEWNYFIANEDQLVDPRTPVRSVESISYPGKDHPAAAEVRSGMLERKSKYLKSYTPGWYVLSPTHLHEFKSPDRVAWQTPVMSLYLPEQKLGSHSQPGSTSHKFMLKGRQTGAMHRGHAWVFRAESHETMMAWYEDIENLIEKTGEARNAFVRRHMRSLSGGSWRASSISSDGVMDEDEADRTPYSAESVMMNQEAPETEAQGPRPQPGGRFGSDVQIDRHINEPMSPSSGESLGDRAPWAATAGVAGSGVPLSHAGHSPQKQEYYEDYGPQARMPNGTSDQSGPVRPERHSSYYGDWIGPAAATTASSPTRNNEQFQQRQPVAYQHNQILDEHPNLASQRSNNSSVPVATSPSINARDMSYEAQANRYESASTVPTTTNVTSRSNNTAQTSLDAVAGVAPAAVAAGAYRDFKGQDSEPSRRDTSSSPGPTSTLASSATSPISSNGIMYASMNPQLQQQDATRPSATSKDSATSLELRIPGRYPPAATA